MPATLQLSLAEYDSMVRVGAFDRIPRKVELIRGELIAMNPDGPIHDDLITYLTDWSADNRDRTKTIITSQTGLNLPEQVSRPEPDLLWLRKDRYRNAHPNASDVQLAIEVSHSSLAYDFEQKRLLYASAGIVEYWIVDATATCIHVFTNPNQCDYTTSKIFKSGEILAPKINPDAKLQLQDLFN
ncbi:MAG: Uma2 family endonuclease [Planctomycetota bacterium]|nr:Uma2 family endonuclease [Planctomycetota bacterium]